MKIDLKSILESLFMPKPNEHTRRNFSNIPYPNGLILIPVPENNNELAEKIREQRG
jgi:hypothetical protein